MQENDSDGVYSQRNEQPAAYVEMHTHHMGGVKLIGAFAFLSGLLLIAAIILSILWVVHLGR